MIQDVEGYISSKRVITFVCAILVITAFLVDLFSEFSVSEYVFNGIMYIVVAGLGFIGAERFGRGPMSGDGE